MKSYIYAHILPDTGEIIYIGSGQQERAWSLHKRSDPHQSVLNNIQRMGFSPADYVVILHGGLEPKEAVELEFLLIRQLKPLFNQQGNGAANAGRGEANALSVFTDAQIISIRKQYADGGISMRAISRQMGTGVSSTRKAIQGRSWTHIN